MARLVGLTVLVVAFAGQPPEGGPGLVHNDNFVISAPSQELAEAVLARAESLRKQIALDWLGEELPPGVGPTSIHLKLSEVSDDNRTCVIDDESCRYHLMWLTTTRSKALGSALAHEITHTVLATQYRGRLAAWAEEGIASLQDDPDRFAARQRTVEWLAKTANWPSIQLVLDVPSIAAKDRAANSVAASLAEYLLQRGDRSKFLEFAVDGKSKGWDTALRHHYGISGVRDLQIAWQVWATKKGTSDARATASKTGKATESGGSRAAPR